MTLPFLRDRLFQSTHPRGVRRPAVPGPGRWRHVSIHAPAWGATAADQRHTAEGHVSIHAPAWGATSAATSPRPCRSSFNPRTRVGCDFGECLKMAWNAVFQSTHPRGVRRKARGLPRIRLPVSIHAPAWGATVAVQHLQHADVVSIHAPAWGATERVHAELAPCTVSIHAPAWGATAGCRRSVLQHFCVSIHAPAWGATSWTSSRTPTRSSFNPRTRVGCDASLERVPHEVLVSIHAPAWGATPA